MQDNIKDNWIDSIDWVQVKQKTKDSAAEADDEEDDDDDDDDEPKDSGDRLQVYREMLKLMKPGESVLKSLRRLGGGKAGMAAASASRRWKEKRAAAAGGNKSTAPEVNRADLLALTGHADRQLQQGNLEIYQATYEKLAFDVSEMEKASADAEAERRTLIPQGVDDDDALDMFADSFDTKGDVKGDPKGDTKGDAKGDTKGDAVSKDKDATGQTENGKLFFLLLVDFRSCDAVFFLLLSPSNLTIFSCDVHKGTTSREVWQL